MNPYIIEAKFWQYCALENMSLSLTVLLTSYMYGSR